MSRDTSDLFAAIRGGRIAIAALTGILLVILLGEAITAAYVEILWQVQTGYLDVFWSRMAWEWGVRVSAGVLVGVVVYFNLKIAATTLGGIQIRRRFGNLEISEQLPKRYVTWALLGASAVLGLWFGAAVTPAAGRAVLLAVSSVPWGEVDPILQRDLGFYAFWYPVLIRLVSYALIVTFLAFTLATGGYSATGAISWVRGRFQAQDMPRAHLGSLLAIFLLLLAARLWLGRYELLMNGNSEVQGIFGSADAQARLPALQTLTVICVGAAVGTLWGALRNRPWPLIGSFASVVVGTVVIGNLYPSLYQRFRVSPNELVAETPFIEHNLDFTRRGFGLHPDPCARDGEGASCLERRAFAYDNEAPIDWEVAAEQMAGLPVWGSLPLLTAYRELEALFPYYGFPRVAIDRYPGADGTPTPVAVSAREVEFSGIQDQNWQNIHLRERYVAGVGAVASLAATRSEDFRPELLLRNIPPEVVPGAVALERLELERPEIFFGTRAQSETRYAVATAGTEQFAAPDGSPGVPGVDFPEGIPLESTFRKLLLAWHFGHANLLFSSELTDESRLIHRRQVVSRARAVAPFLEFPETPYPVISGGKVIWILEGFTSTAAYPMATLHDFGPRRRRYVRNSFKVTVDAVTGDLAFYRVPVHDPLADALQAAYEGLVQPMSEMPAELRAHLRYPRVLLALQTDVLRLYHQETASAFHGGQDVWTIPRELAVNENEVDYEPEYGVYRLPWEDEARFQLTTVFVPQGRENLTAMIVARTDDRGVPELTLVDIPVGDQVSGPRQVESFVEQDPDISEQFSLWRTSGSQVWTGHLHLIPVGNRIVYMEPVYLAAEADAIPELRRFVVSDGRRVVMTQSLEESVAALAGAPSTGRRRAGTTGQGTDPASEASQTGGRAADAGAPDGDGTREWSAEALRLLERAEERARQGDWQGYGEALDELRALLSRLGGNGG